MLVSGRGEKGGGLWVAKVLLLSKIIAKRCVDSQEYTFWQNMETVRPIDLVDTTPGCVC